ncbi:hypothetical protein AAMO2058_000999900 [Amorphochlora amoebiformis]
MGDGAVRFPDAVPCLDPSCKDIWDALPETKDLRRMEPEDVETAYSRMRILTYRMLERFQMETRKSYYPFSAFIGRIIRDVDHDGRAGRIVSEDSGRLTVEGRDGIKWYMDGEQALRGLLHRGDFLEEENKTLIEQVRRIGELERQVRRLKRRVLKSEALDAGEEDIEVGYRDPSQHLHLIFNEKVNVEDSYEPKYWPAVKDDKANVYSSRYSFQDETCMSIRGCLSKRINNIHVVQVRPVRDRADPCYCQRDHNLGVFAVRPIKKGSFVLSYIGKISHDGMDNGSSSHEDVNTDYDLELGRIVEEEKESVFVIQPKQFGNEAKYINDYRFHSTKIFAIRDIEREEQLLIDYGGKYWERKTGGKKRKRHLQIKKAEIRVSRRSKEKKIRSIERDPEGWGPIPGFGTESQSKRVSFSQSDKSAKTRNLAKWNYNKALKAVREQTSEYKNYEEANDEHCEEIDLARAISKSIDGDQNTSDSAQGSNSHSSRHDDNSCDT